MAATNLERMKNSHKGNEMTPAVLIPLIGFLLAGCVSAQPIQKLEVTVYDEQGALLEGAEVSVAFRQYRGDPIVKTEITGEDGFVSLSERAPLAPTLSVRKSGYYESRIEKVNVVTPENADSIVASRSFEIRMRAIQSPRALIAKSIKIDIPIKNKWVGYDLEKGDWVQPYGNGSGEDIRVRYQNKFLGYNISKDDLEKVRKREAQSGNEWTEETEKRFYGDWSGRLEIQFSKEGEGVLIVKRSNGYIQESHLRMPHLAPELGYQDSITWDDVRNGQFMPRNGDGYFLRLRVKKRGNKIIEANYAKIYHEMDFDPRGKIAFSYAFNSDVNDRNLEFNTSNNLLRLDDVSEWVRQP